MPPTITKRRDEIDAVLRRLAAQTDKGTTNVRGMTYEQGAETAILWLTGESDEHPYPDPPDDPDDDEESADE